MRRFSAHVNLLLTVSGILLTAVFLNVLLSGSRLRMDLSENKVNLLSEASKAAMGELEGLEIRLYISDDLPESIPFGRGELRIQGFSGLLRDQIQEYLAFGKDVKLKDIKHDLIEEARAAGIHVFSGEGASLKRGRLKLAEYVLGLSFHYKNASEVFDLALQPEFYEFEITKRLLRLKEKAEASQDMKEALDAGDALLVEVRHCQSAIKEAGQEAPGSADLLLAQQQVGAEEQALRGAREDIERACQELGGLIEGREALGDKYDAWKRLSLVSKAWLEELEAFLSALEDEGSPLEGLLSQQHRLLQIAALLEQEKRALDEKPGQKKLGFVCNGEAFCPFPMESPLLPEELQRVIGQENPWVRSILPVLLKIDQQMNGILGQLNQGLFRADDLSVEAIDLDKESPRALDALVLFGPTEELSEAALYQLDQFLLAGKSVVIFLSPFQVEMQAYQANGQISESGEILRTHSNIEDYLRFQGLSLSGKLLLDPVHHGQLALFTQFIRQGGQVIPFQQAAFDVPSLVRFSKFNKNSPLVRATTSLVLPYVSTLDFKGKEGLQISPLIYGSPEGRLADVKDFPIYPPEAQTIRAESIERAGEQVVGALLEGEFQSYFQDKDRENLLKRQKDTKDADGPDLDALLTSYRGKGEGKLLVVASNMGLRNLSRESVFKGFNPSMLTQSDEIGKHLELIQTYPARFQNWSMAWGQIQHTLEGNLRFFQNVLDWSVQREALAELRSRHYTPRPLKALQEGGKAKVQLMALTLPSLLFLALALGLLLLKRRRDQGLDLGI